MRAFVALTVLAVLVSGCAESPQPPPQDASAPLAGATDAPPPAPPSTVTANATEASADPLARPVVAVSWDGTLPDYVWACLEPTPPCVGYVGEGGEHYRVFDAPTNASEADLTLTWTPSSERTRELRIGIFRVWQEGEDEQWERIGDAFARGPSPLALRHTFPPLAEGERVGIVVISDYHSAGPIRYAAAHTKQTFYVEGVLAAKT